MRTEISTEECDPLVSVVKVFIYVVFTYLFIYLRYMFSVILYEEFFV